MRAAQIKGRGGQSYLGPYTRGRNRKSLFKCPRWSYLCPRPLNIIAMATGVGIGAAWLWLARSPLLVEQCRLAKRLSNAGILSRGHGFAASLSCLEMSRQR